MQQLTNSLNKLATERMKIGIKEHILHSQAYEALEIVQTLEVNTVEDVLLFCAAMNLLNTYVKQRDRYFGYYFKSYLNYLFETLLKNSLPEINIGIDISVTKKGTAVAYVIVQIENVQFSFHQISVSNELLELKQNTNIVKELTFDGIRKQMCASAIFEMVKNI